MIDLPEIFAMGRGRQDRVEKNSSVTKSVVTGPCAARGSLNVLEKSISNQLDAFFSSSSSLS